MSGSPLDGLKWWQLAIIVPVFLVADAIDKVKGVFRKK